MKLAGAKIEAFLRSPSKDTRAILLFGPDSGLIREHGRALVELLNDSDDPFSISEITGDALRKDGALLADSAQSMSLMGGDPVVRVRDTTDSVAEIVEAWLDAGGGVKPAVFEAGELAPRAKLRKLFESRKDTAAIGCYPDEGRDLETVVREHMKANGITLQGDAMPVLMSRLGNDRLAIRQELDKLVMYAGGPGSNGNLTARDVEQLTGDVKSASLDEISFSVSGGDTARLSHALDQALAEGLAPIAIIRAIQRHLDRLHSVKAESEKGSSIEDAMRRLRPPVFFKVTGAFAAQARAWSAKDLARGLGVLLQAERDCKSGLEVDRALCERALLQLTQAARRSRR